MSAAHDGNALADMADGTLDDDDARPGVSAFAVAQVLSPVAAARAAVGLPTRPPGTPNRVRFEEIEGAVVAVYPACDCGGRGYYGDGEACVCAVGAR